MIYSIAASYKTKQTIWAGTDDGLVWITRDGGANWTNITPPGVAPWSKIAQIDASRFDDDTAYVAVNRLRSTICIPYIFRTHDGGKTWDSISAGLPDDAPVNAVRADPVQPGLLYAATEKAVWVSFDDGQHWRPLQYNLPHTSMRDLLVKDDDLIVATHGRSFWIIDDVSPLRQIAADPGETTAVLFRPADTWRVRRDTNTDTPLPPTNQPEKSAGWCDPRLQPASTRTYRDPRNSGHRRQRIAEIQQRRSRFADARRTANGIDPSLLAANPWSDALDCRDASLGMGSARHRSHGHAIPIPSLPCRSHAAGSARPPGCPRNIHGAADSGWRERDRIVTVKMDPRVHMSQPELEALHTAQVTMANSLDAVAKADLQAHAVMEQAAAIQDSALVSQLAPFNAVLKTIVDGTGPNAAKRLPGIDEVTAEATQLYGELEQADANPTSALLAAAAHVQMEGKEVLPGWEDFKQTQLPAMNREIRNAHHPAINPDRKPSNMPEAGDED